MQSRRNFIGKVASGVAGALATHSAHAAGERVRLGIIGPGDRGTEILREALACANVECVGAADIYTRRLDAVKQIAPNAKTYLDYRHLLDDQSVDAVLIATPQHLHCEHFNAALAAGKHVYQEKTMAFTVDHAKKMRTAYKEYGEKKAVQIGHQWTSYGHVQDAQSFLKPELIGQVTSIEAHMYRNTPRGKPQWSRPVYQDMTPEHIIWKSFLGDRPEVPFDANRYVNWRFFWDYSGGNVYENMCHQFAFWTKCMNLQIPQAVTMIGGLYLWKDGREVPDTMNVSMQLPEQMLWNWTSGFGNDKLGVTEDVLGDNGTIMHTPQSIAYTPQKVNRRDGNELRGMTPNQRGAHMQNFIDAVRDPSKPTNCPFDIGFRVSIACRMAVESYRLGRTVRWDATKEEIV